MKEYEIKINDFLRMLIGEVPLHYYLESLFRLAFIYLILMSAMRLMGRRMSTQLSRNEMAAVVSLAAAIGVPLMSPDRGLLLAVVIAFVIIGFQYLISRIASINKKFESLTQDRYDILIEDGVLNLKVMHRTRVSRDRVFSQLRTKGITHLGMIKRLYFEASGGFSFLKQPGELPGLSIVPSWDLGLDAEIHRTSENIICDNCGLPQENADRKDRQQCSNCGNPGRTMAVQNWK